MHRDVREEFVAKLARLVTERVVLGDPFDERDDDGAAEQRRRRREDGRARRRRARARRGARQRRRARRRLPDESLLAGDGARQRAADAALVAQEETFGPVAPVVAIDSLEQAIELTNASPYGLLSAIFTRDLAKGLRYADSVRTGWVNINESSNYWESAPAVRRPLRHRERHRPRRRHGADGGVHRAADGGVCR